MKHVFSTFARILSVVALLIFLAGPLYADPIIVVAPSNAPGAVPWPINPVTGEPTFVEFVTNPAGSVAGVPFVNNTNFVFTDFHFTFPAQPALASGNTSTFFHATIGTTTSVDFFAAGGTGIRIGEGFSISMTGFNGVTIIRATPTFVPEPATMLLLGTGLAGVAIKTRKRLKNRKSG